MPLNSSIVGASNRAPLSSNHCAVVIGRPITVGVFQVLMMSRSLAHPLEVTWRTFSAWIGSSPKCQNRTGGGSYLHIRRAVSYTLSSLRLSSSMERSFPMIEEAKPHWGLSAKRSNGTKRFASVMRRMRSSGASVCGRLVLINPRTTVLSSGTCRRGANEPDRSSSYSRRSRVAPMRWKIGRAIAGGQTTARS